MNPEIASIHDRMAKGGNWMIFREEIARLHKEAKTQEEYVTLLEAHWNLIAVAEECFSPEQCAEIRRIAEAEYKLFLNIEAMEDGQINPVMLDRVTAREVQSGRLAPDSEFRSLAAAGGEVLGDSADMRYDRKLGDVIGMTGIVLGALTFFLVSRTAGIAVFVLGMGAGWFINERRKGQALEQAQANRTARGYD